MKKTIFVISFMLAVREACGSLGCNIPKSVPYRAASEKTIRAPIEKRIDEASFKKYFLGDVKKMYRAAEGKSTQVRYWIFCGAGIEMTGAPENFVPASDEKILDLFRSGAAFDVLWHASMACPRCRGLGGKCPECKGAAKIFYPAIFRVKK